jgi:hypothetical protein
MSERLSAVGGTLEVRPDLHPGFCLIATVPTTVPTTGPPVAPPAPTRTASEATNS